jgi:exodeoxyribonuclease VII large subunit
VKRGSRREGRSCHAGGAQAAARAEGLFDDPKKPIPLLPSRIVVVTSPTGAALRDILTVTRRRNPGIDILILPAPVQGEGAAEIIARQIRLANAHRLGDVIIVGRGGGSIEDLLPSPMQKWCGRSRIRRSGYIRGRT